MNWAKTNVTLNDGRIVTAQAPIIISASRSTDIPAFYGDWFMERISAGYVKWINPFNGIQSYVSFENTRLIVFWSKNPKPLIKHLARLDEKIENYYFQFTLNDYDKEKLEKKVPKLSSRIETFVHLSETLSADRVIWRFDPLILTEKIGVEELLRKIENIGDQIAKYTRKLVFSFADISVYKKVENNLKQNQIKYREFEQTQMYDFAEGLRELNSKWNLQLATCCENVDLDIYGISHNRCVDGDLIVKLFSHDDKLMNFMGVKFEESTLFDPSGKVIVSKNLKDKGQRQFCGCIISKDIGQYNTCPHDCVYCYANSSVAQVNINYKSHQLCPNSETITGK